jgi:uncharacterized SAM-binding protein YcdF (DUF218 family)
LFFLKKIISQILYPLNFSLLVLLAGIVMIWMRGQRWKKVGKVLATMGAFLLVLCSYSFIAEALLISLEYEYPALKSVQSFSHIEYVVVLGGGKSSDERLPSTTQLSGSSIARLIEGIRIHRQIAGSRLILAGGAVYDPVPEAQVMAEAAIALGVEADSLVLEAVSKDTQDQAANIREIVGNAPFIMVTSASHMRRAAGMFRKQGLQPIPAPADYWVKNDRAVSPADFFPSPDNLRKLQRAVHEYVGIGWAKMRGQM